METGEINEDVADSRLKERGPQTDGERGVEVRGDGADQAQAASFQRPKILATCSKHSRRSWSRQSRPSSPEAKPASLAAALACRRVKAPTSRQVKWRCCSSSDAVPEMGNREASRSRSTRLRVARSQSRVQGAAARKQSRIAMASCQRKVSPLVEVRQSMRWPSERGVSQSRQCSCESVLSAAQ